MLVQSVMLKVDTGPASICGDCQTCTFRVKVKSLTEHEDTNNPDPMVEDKKMDFEFNLVVSPGAAAGTHVVSASDYSNKLDAASPEYGEETDHSYSAEAQEEAEFGACMEQTSRRFTHGATAGAIHFVAPSVENTNPSNWDANSVCGEHANEIFDLLTGSITTIGQSTVSTADPTLLEFETSEDNMNGRRTTQHRRVQHADGGYTVHRKHVTIVPRLIQAVPVGTDSVDMQGTSTTTVDADGTVQATQERGTTVIGTSSTDDGFVCGSGTADNRDSSVDCEAIPSTVATAEKARLEIDFSMSVVKTGTDDGSCPTTELAAYKTQLQQQGFKLVPASEAIQARAEKPVEEPVNAEEGMPQFLQALEDVPDETLELSQTKAQIEKALKSSTIRKHVVHALMQNEIKNHRAVQLLMHLIGYVGTKQPTAISQLLALAHNKKLSLHARQQALGGLLQAKCYDHSHAIEGLSKLAQNPQNDIEWMAAHVQHGLIGHLQHCKQGSVGHASEYDELMQQTHANLADAVKNKEEQNALKWLDAIGNTHTQAPESSDAIALVARNEKLSAGMRVVAVHNLGKIFSDTAQKHMNKLLSDPDYFVQEAALEGLAGKHLAASDPRLEGILRPVAALVQTQADWGIKKEKVWPTPSSGDIRAEPKVGVEIKNEGTKKCLHGYAGVDGKAWSWTVSLIQAGGKKCSGTAFEKYVSVLGIKIWPGASAGQRHPDTAQFSQAGDQQGECKMNVDAADLVATIAWDKNFFTYDRTFSVCGYPINGLISLDGQIGMKVGYGNLGAPNVGNSAAACSSGIILFAIPYAQATLTGELSLDLALAKGGVGVNVILVKFSLPATSEKLGDDQSTCAGIYFKAETLGGRVYGFVDIIKSAKIKSGGGCWCCFWTWKIVRTWNRLGEVTFYEWSSPHDYVSNDLKCSGPISGCVDTPGWHDSDGSTYNCAWYGQGSRCATYGNGYARLGKTAKQACCACK